MKILEVSTDIEHEAVIERLQATEFKNIKASGIFGFDWGKYKKLEVYKLSLAEDNSIQGLMCIIDHTDSATNAIEIEALEAIKGNTRGNKKFDWIAGCLIAFACRESIRREHDGFVFLKPKSYLLKSYHAKYGFKHWPLKSPGRPEGIMILELHGSNKLIKKYLE